MTNVGRAGVLGLAFGLLCCSHPTGPSLTAVVLSQKLISTAPGTLGEQTCCCHILGSVQNTSTINVDITLDWYPTDASGNSLGLATDFEKNMAPGAVAPFNAAGIFAPCSQVNPASLTPQVLVFGLFTPPAP